MMVVLRRLGRPGGNLSINATATEGELKIRITDEKRKPIPGFNYDDCKTFTADLYTFRAVED